MFHCWNCIEIDVWFPFITTVHIKAKWEASWKFYIIFVLRVAVNSQVTVRPTNICMFYIASIFNGLQCGHFIWFHTEFPPEQNKAISLHNYKDPTRYSSRESAIIWINIVTSSADFAIVVCNLVHHKVDPLLIVFLELYMSMVPCLIYLSYYD